MTTTTTKAKSVREASIEVWRRAKARMDDPRAMWGLPWPFEGLNKTTGGIHESEMSILTARPSMGKTQIMVQTAESVTGHLLTDDGQRDYPGGVVKLVLCEGTTDEFIRRWACLRSGVSKRRVEDGSLRDYPEKMERFKRELEAISQLPVEFLDSARSLDEIQRFLTDGPTAWWALDYAQKCPIGPGRPNDGSVGPITVISGVLSEIAKLKAPGLVLAHTPREVDKREDRRPRMGDIKGGSAFEGDARVVLGLYNERVYAKLSEADMSKPGQAEISVLKNNNGGGVGRTIDLVFQPKRGMFIDVSNIMEELEDDDE